ncbi:MAG: hypothetical protein PVJ43_06615 [Gemmatimonadales bacterium]|jgi:hypothetical protein
MPSRVNVVKDSVLWVAAFLFALLIYAGLILSAVLIQRRKVVANGSAGGGVDWSSPGGLLGNERLTHA